VPVRPSSSIYTVVPRKVVNKVTLNFVNAPEMTPQLVKANLGYINNTVPGIDLVNDGVPALMYAIKETKCIETLLLASLNSKDVELIKALKQGEFKTTPNGVIDAFKKGVLFDFINFKIRNLFNLNEVTEATKSNSKLDFQ
jgi:hypothetical protein